RHAQRAAVDRAVERAVHAHLPANREAATQPLPSAWRAGCRKLEVMCLPSMLVLRAKSCLTATRSRIVPAAACAVHPQAWGQRALRECMVVAAAVALVKASFPNR